MLLTWSRQLIDPLGSSFTAERSETIKLVGTERFGL